MIPDEPRTKAVRIVNEKTQFVLAGDATTYPLILRNFQTSYEDNYRTVALTGLHPESLVALPLFMELPGTAWLAITEANIQNYPVCTLPIWAPGALAFWRRAFLRAWMNPASRFHGRRPWNRHGAL